MIYISEDIHRLKVCQWAYGWSKDELIFEINKMIDKKQWECFFENQRRTREATKNLILELEAQKTFDMAYLLKENKTKSYGNKYIKRKHRF